MSEALKDQYADSANLQARADLFARFSKTDWFGWIAEQLDLDTGENVLDVGCGPGWLWRNQFGSLPARLSLTLVDTSEGMLFEAKTALRNSSLKLETCTADAAALPFPSECFDIVLLMHVLYHVSDPSLALTEAHRVLRPGGRVLVTTNALDNLHQLTALGSQAFGGDAVDRGAARFSLDDAERAMRQLFTEVHRRNHEEIMSCTDPDVASGHLLSMPPGNKASSEQRAHLVELVVSATKDAGGSFEVTRRTGAVFGKKASR